MPVGFPQFLGRWGRQTRRSPRIEGKPWVVFDGSHEVAQPRSLFSKNYPRKPPAPLIII